ncbi:MAG: D-alanine--D-alanine ligase [Lachnospiraceae bacterium]|nr:D-alanine--D-alanine ligase [Lachnospiraceae bacterium]
MKTRVAVLFGGKSVEHEVSVISAIQAIMSMDTEKYDIIPVYMTKANDMYVGEGIGDIKRYKDIPGLLASSELVNMVREDGRFYLVSMKKKAFKKETKIEFDIVFPIVHGTNVEDGTLQGFLKTIGTPFVGCDVTASAIGMDKYAQKLVLKENDVPILDSLIFTLKDYEDINAIVERSEQRMGYPVIVKPVNLGSSVGIGVAKSREELIKKIDDAFSYSRRIIIEHAITYLREINCSVLGDENEAEASECEEPMHSEDILSYEDKYVSNAKGGKSSGMASVARKVPAEISPELREQIRTLAVKSFKTLGCNGVARIDFMLDEDNGHIYFNEINTIPGSLAFYLWEPVGVPYKELLDRMIELGLKRAREESNITYAFDTNILNMDVLGGSKGSKI